MRSAGRAQFGAITGDAIQGQAVVGSVEATARDGWSRLRPVWSPSGSMIALASSRSGSAENHEMREDRMQTASADLSRHSGTCRSSARRMRCPGQPAGKSAGTSVTAPMPVVSVGSTL